MFNLALRIWLARAGARRPLVDRGAPKVGSDLRVRPWRAQAAVFLVMRAHIMAGWAGRVAASAGNLMAPSASFVWQPMPARSGEVLKPRPGAGTAVGVFA